MKRIQFGSLNWWYRTWRGEFWEQCLWKRRKDRLWFGLGQELSPLQWVFILLHYRSQAIHCNGREGKMQLHFSHCILLLISLVLHTVSLLREVRVNASFILWQEFLFYFCFLIQCLTHSRYVINAEMSKWRWTWVCFSLKLDHFHQILTTRLIYLCISCLGLQIAWLTGRVDW